MNKIFASNAQLDDGGKRPPYLDSKTNAVLSTVKFRSKKVLKKLRNLGISNAIGPDVISSTVLKNFAPELAPVLAKLFQILL